MNSHAEITTTGIYGESLAIEEIHNLIRRVAPAQTNILITGESGTGKELVAKAIHRLSPRSSHPFIAINCTAIPQHLLESELFGHSKGSFTGAHERRKGLFEEANGGTLFLDEIGDLEIGLQSKLLRVLQERRIKSVGDNISKPINVRIVTATHKNLKKSIVEKTFREDLYYRLCVIPIHIPPLRERTNDIPVLAKHFLRKYAGLNEKLIYGFTAQAMAELIQLPWAGNVRELENLIERLVVLTENSEISETEIKSANKDLTETIGFKYLNEYPTLEQVEQNYIQKILQKTQGRKEQAASILGISRRTLYRKEKEFKISI